MKDFINGEKLKYIRYSRKSDEAKERQVYSIEDQNKECQEYAEKLSLDITSKFQEEKSGYAPGKRVAFNKVVELIKDGKANAILTWNENRICRNPLEGGIIMQLLQDGILKEIRIASTNTVYTPSSDHLMLHIQFGMANQFSRKISTDVKRGLFRKAERKEYPFPAPIGYEGYGEVRKRQMRPDPIRAPFIQKAFQLASTGVYSLGYISEALYKEGFRTKKGKKASKSHIDLILRRPTYCGHFLLNGELFEGRYEPLVSKALFEIVQEKLKDRSRPKNINWQKEFVGLMKCGTCGCAITTSIKKKFVKKINDYHTYIFHHCTHRRGNCKEKPMTDYDLKELLTHQVGAIEIDEEAWKLGIEIVREKYKNELEKNKGQHFFYSLEQQRIRDKIQKLIDMRTGEELTKEEFLEQKNDLLKQLSSFESKTNDSNQSLKTWLELMEDFFNTALYIKDMLKSDDAEEKQKILRKIGENFIIKDKKLCFSFKKPYDVLLKPEYRSDLLGRLDSNQNKQLQRLLSYH